ncbi:MAG: DUF86 domain-containing protein [Anaerolineaceae bacterium]|nr:DUF86 domain-containing protein [Anaerolineaceae bacterium]
MSRSDVDYLRDIIQELDDIIAFTQEADEKAFVADIRTQKAVIRSYEVIGEICKRLPSALRTNNAQIDWRRLITFRDFLAHNYDVIAVRYIWDAVQDVPALRAAVEAMLASLPEDEQDE